MTETQRKAYEAFVASGKAFFEMEAERLGWTQMRNISTVCKTYLATFMDDVEDTCTCVANRLVLEIGVFHDCTRTPVHPCEGCSEVESIYYAVSTDSDHDDMLRLWEQWFNDNPEYFMPDCFKWTGGNTDPEIKDEDEDEECDIDLTPYDDDDDIFDFADPGGVSALRAETSSNPRIHDCPQCRRHNMLTPRDVALGYVCDRCAGLNEGPGY